MREIYYLLISPTESIIRYCDYFSSKEVKYERKKEVKNKATYLILKINCSPFPSSFYLNSGCSQFNLF